jgi:hypothetical protein
MYLYPGGFTLDGIIYPTTSYKFSKNFFSDLGLLTTVTGRSNLPSRVLFCIGVTLVALSFIFHSVTLSSYFSKDSIQQKIVLVGSYAGIGSAFSFIGIAFTPGNMLPLIHSIFLYVGFSSAGIYCLCLIIALFKEKTYPNIRGYVPITFIIALVIFFIILLDGPPRDSFSEHILQVVMQKVIVYQLILLLSIEGLVFLFLLRKQKQLKEESYIEVPIEIPPKSHMQNENQEIN